MIDNETINRWAYDGAPTCILRALCRAWTHSDLLPQNAGQYRSAVLEPAIKAEIAAVAEREKLRNALAMVADIAHSGGLVGHDEHSALMAIRRLTLTAWNPHGTTEEHRERVKEAGREAGAV